MLDLTQPWELLAEEALIPVRFNTGATGLGKNIVPGSHERDVQPGAEVDLPLWLVQPLQARNAVIVKLPSNYKDKYRRKLNAGAECVSFRNSATYFYEVGNKLNQLLQDVELSAFLSRTFRTRYFELISRGLNTMTGERILSLSSKLSTEEQQLFEAGRISIAQFDSWLRGLNPQAQPSMSRSSKRSRSVGSDLTNVQSESRDGSKQARPR